MSWPKNRWFWAITITVLGVIAVTAWVFRPRSFDPGDPRLGRYVHKSPDVPIIFTSRTEPASFLAAAPSGEGFDWPGRPFWQAREGRLRMLKPDGTVHELTWKKQLDDGETIIDVMSPNVSPDGRLVVFAGRTNAKPSRFRLFEIDLAAKRIRRLTGGKSDQGAVRMPPLRYAKDGSLLSEQERRAIDYDDIDPAYLTEDMIVFASSRQPDLGRGHARRATNLWVMKTDGSELKMRTANRNNDRWPFLTSPGFVIFSLWSRNTEVVTADLRGIQPYEDGMTTATLPTDIWMGALMQPNGEQFGALVKPNMPVWRPRPLFNGRVVFMTPSVYPLPETAEKEMQIPPMQIVQALPGLVHSVPSSRPADAPMPRPKAAGIWQSPIQTVNGKGLSVATPSPFPPNHMVVSAATGDDEIDKKKYGIYLADAAWPEQKQQISSKDLKLQLLFDDPEFVDTEPVGVYPRAISQLDLKEVMATEPVNEKQIQLADGTSYKGPAGQIVSASIFLQDILKMPGQETDAGEKPIFRAPPPGKIKTVRIYASHRDRFDDPKMPRKIGGWELLREVPLQGSGFETWLPTTSPTVLAGFDSEGRVASWQTQAKDSEGRSANFFAFAGDHYSGVRPGGYHFCTGCHAGHTTHPVGTDFGEKSPQ